MLGALIGACSATEPRRPLHTSASEPARTAFVDVDVLPMDTDTVLRSHTLLVEGDRIAGLGPSHRVRVAPGWRVVDGGGRFLTPGLVDAHVHLRAADTTALLDYLRVGVTTARDMNGRPFLLRWRDRIAAGELRGPTLVVASPTLANVSSPKEGYPTPATEEEGREAVRRFHADGYDLIKVYTFLPAAAFRGVADEARRLEIPVAGHVPIAVGLEEALASRLRSIEHLTQYVSESLTPEAAALDEEDFRSVFHAGDVDTKRLRALVDATVEAGVWNVPTIVWFDRILPAPVAEEAWSRPELRRQGERNRRLLLRLLHQAGAPLAVGTDSDAGEDLPAASIHDELAAWHAAGVPSWDALRAATVGGAELIGMEDEIGTIEVGKRADLLLLACDPLGDLACLSRPEAVFTGGVAVPPP